MRVAGGLGGAPMLDGNRKLAIINGMGDHSRAQGNSSAVKEAIGAISSSPTEICEPGISRPTHRAKPAFCCRNSASSCLALFLLVPCLFVRLLDELVSAYRPGPDRQQGALSADVGPCALRPPGGRHLLRPRLVRCPLHH